PTTHLFHYTTLFRFHRQQSYLCPWFFSFCFNSILYVQIVFHDICWKAKKRRGRAERKSRSNDNSIDHFGSIVSHRWFLRNSRIICKRRSFIERLLIRCSSAKWRCTSGICSYRNNTDRLIVSSCSIRYSYSEENVYR